MTALTKAPLYVLDPRAVVGRRGGRVVVTVEGRVVASAPIMRLSEVVLLGKPGITIPALHLLLGHDVPVVLLRSDGRALGRVEPPGSPHVVLRQVQTARCGDPVARLQVGRACVAGKLRNQRALLRARARRSRDAHELDALAQRVEQQERAAVHAESIEVLLGVEGAGAGAYFRGIRLLAGGHGFTRRDRSAPDVVNALVNYTSALLREVVIGAIVAAGLDPHASFLHQPTRGRPTLAFDLMEEWRPVLVEATVLGVLGLRTVGPADITRTPAGPRLTSNARAAAIARFRFRLARPARGRPQPAGEPTYGECVRRQARLLRRWVLGDAEEYEAFRWR